MAHFFYFAWVREKIGTPKETLSLPESVTNVEQLRLFLQKKGEPYSTVLEDKQLRIAINQTYARSSDPVCDKDEIALFPPVSGG